MTPDSYRVDQTANIYSRTMSEGAGINIEIDNDFRCLKIRWCGQEDSNLHPLQD